MTELVDIADLDCIFLTYDEPNAEENWVHVRNMVPWATRVDGVKGSDAAHKAAAMASTTDRFVLIDGDNIPDIEFFSSQLVLDDASRDCVFRWRARNNVNGLMYGNGGVSCWTRDFVMNMRTHEASEGTDETAVEFCFDPRYWAMHDCYSTTYINTTDFQAWRAGFREGVKMCLIKGRRPTIPEFQQQVHQRNLDNLTIWHNIGRDVDNGIWAIAGARMGTYMTMITDWDYTQVQWFDHLADLWNTVKDRPPEQVAGTVVEDLITQLGLPIGFFHKEESDFFKKHVNQSFKNRGIMTKEIDVIRQQEGW
jgi:hypothetical protein